MKRVVALGVLCSLVAVCLAGSQVQDVSSVEDVHEPSVVSSLFPKSESSTYLLAFPVNDDDTNSNPEEVHSGGGGTTEIATEEPSPAEKDEKEEMLTLVLKDPKEGEKNKVSVPVQDLQPKDELKFFPSAPSPPPFSFVPFKSEPVYRERKFPFPPPFLRFRPTLIPPMRNFLQSLRKEPPTNKISPVSFINAASLIRRALGTKLRMLNDMYQPTRIAKKLVVFPPVAPPEPRPSVVRFPMPMFMPLPQPSHPMFARHVFPLRRPFMLDAPPPLMLPPMPMHSSLFSPPFPIAPTPFMPPSSPFIYSVPPRRAFFYPLPPPMPVHDIPPFPLYRFSSRPLYRPPLAVFDTLPAPFQRLPPPSPLQFEVPLRDLPRFQQVKFSSRRLRFPMPMYDPPSFPTHPLSFPPQPFMQHRLQEVVMPEPENVPSFEPPSMPENLQETHPASGEDDLVFSPPPREITNPEEPPPFMLYPNDSEMPQREINTPKRRLLLDLLYPSAGKVRRVIHQTRIIHYKPDKTEVSSNELESSQPPFHKPFFRVMDL